MSIDDLLTELINTNRYPWTSVVIAIGRLGIVLSVALSYPLQAHPCRACLHTLTKDWHLINTSTGEDEHDNEEADTLMGKDDHGLPVGKPMGQRKFVSLTTGILLLGFAIAMVIDELEVGKSWAPYISHSGHFSFYSKVLSFVGSTGSTMISFILPGMFYFSLFRHERSITKWLAFSLATYGVVVMTFW
jgi:amino acid permease